MEDGGSAMTFPAALTIRQCIATVLLTTALTSCARLAREEALDKGVTAYRAEDYATARAQWAIAADQGDPTAQNNLGYLLFNGLGGPADPARAVALWKQAAAAGHSEAQLQCMKDREAGQVALDGIVDAQDEDGRTALMSASAIGNADAVARLVQHGAQTDVRDKAFGKTALMYAAENERSAAAEQLLRAGAKPDVRDDQGWTALCYAALNIRPATLVVLLQAHSSVNVQTNDGRSPLIIAAREGNAKTVELLLEAGADPSLRDKDGKTALAWATSKGSTAVQALLEAETNH